MVAASSALLLAGVALEIGEDVADGVPVTAGTALLGVLAALGAAGLVWLMLGVVLEALARVPGAVGRRAAGLSRRLSPVVVRQCAAVVLGVGLGSGTVAGAQATPAVDVTLVAGSSVSADPGSDHGSPARADLPDPTWGPGPDPGWTPAPPTVRPQPDVRAIGGPTRPAEDEGAEVVVHRGDSLWTIAARHLGEEATDAEIADAWPRWYAANRDVIGADPDRLLPGQVLRSPDATVATS